MQRVAQLIELTPLLLLLLLLRDERLSCMLRSVLSPLHLQQLLGVSWDYRKKRRLPLYLGSIVGKDQRLPSVHAALGRQKPSELGLKSKHPWVIGEMASFLASDTRMMTN